MIQRPPKAGAAARFNTDGAGSLTQERLLVMLYERLERDLHSGADAIRAGDREASHQALLHAQEIIGELDAALDRDVWGGAGALSDVYRFLMDRLVVANVRQDAAAVDDCARVVRPLAETWNEAWATVSSAPRSTAPVAAAPPDPITGASPTITLDVVS